MGALRRLLGSSDLPATGEEILVVRPRWTWQSLMSTRPSEEKSSWEQEGKDVLTGKDLSSSFCSFLPSSSRLNQ
jgi:hypothetical protein